MTMPPSSAPVAQEPAPTSARPGRQAGWLNLAVDYGPVVVFFLAYKLNSPTNSHDALGEIMAVTRSTAAFMIAAVAALVISRLWLKHVSPMLWLSTGLIVVFGGLTVWSQAEGWIRHKPTVIYLVFAAILLGGWWRKKPLIRDVLEAAFEGLDIAGWLKLSRNWGLFFLFFAGLNEALCLRVNGQWLVPFPTWITLKLWLFMPLSFLFTFSQIPMLLRHGLLQAEPGPDQGAPD